MGLTLAAGKIAHTHDTKISECLRRSSMKGGSTQGAAPGVRSQEGRGQDRSDKEVRLRKPRIHKPGWQRRFSLRRRK